MGERVMVVAVHPDDETLGCGGTLLRHAAAGDSLHWLLLTAAHEPLYAAAEVAGQAAEVSVVERAYPFTSLDWLRLPTTRLETIPLGELVARIREVVARVRPAVLFVPNRSDAHSDHRVAFQATLAVVKSFTMAPLGVRRVLACEVPSETEAGPPLAENAFVPNVLVDVGATLERKLEILAHYRSQVQAEPGPRSLSAVRALARWRGASGGLQDAEAFTLIRELV
jgi:N-acetylglucosamine malate deacetylase 1